MEKETQNISFALNRISTEQFAIIGEQDFSSKNIQLITNIRYGANEYLKMISCFVEVVFESHNKPFLKVEGACHFNIEDNSWKKMVNKEDNTICLPNGFVRHLAILTAGTTRGILHTKTEGTDYNKFVLPTINIAEMITEDAILKLN